MSRTRITFSTASLAQAQAQRQLGPELSTVQSTIDPSRDLLFGLLALQNGLIEQGQLVAAFQAWTRDKGRPMAEHLIARGDLDPDDRDVVMALVGRHLKRHGGALEKSLAAINATRSTRESLAALGDVDIDASIAYIDVGATTAESDENADRTASLIAGTGTNDGPRFQRLRPHARGGLGEVFVALDAELNREVALKQILERHADNPTSRQRFVIEAEVTGGLEHPGIVPVYGLGTFGDGRPYYAMRFIRGDSLKDAVEEFHADKNLHTEPGRRALALRKLLRRFLDVCNAIDYAHSRGVIHRDIKPANIIVGTHGETLVVDWGLAKAMGQSDPESLEGALIPRSASGSAETLPGSAMGTPAYMSPEQARGETDQLGTHSDVCSLGATLYFLLTGKPPFDGDDLGEVLRAAGRGKFLAPRALDPSIDPALEAVCLKAMALRPGDRYATAKALAEDLERWMADEPVIAWREPWSRTIVRWLTRHRTAVTGVGAALVMAVAGLAGVLGVQTRANGQLMAKNAQLDESVKRESARFQLALEAIKLFHGEVSEDLLLKEKQFGGLRARLLRGAADFYGKLEGLLQNQKDPQSRVALGAAYAELAKITADVGNSSAALAVHRKALAVRRELAEEPGASAERILDLARSLIDTASLERRTGDVAAATESYKEAQKRVETLEAGGKGSDASQFVLARILFARSAELLSSRPAEARELNDRQTLILERLVEKNPADIDYQDSLAKAHRIQGVLLTNANKPIEALAAFRREQAIFENLTKTHPNIWRFQSSLGTTYNNMTSNLADLGLFTEALASQRRSVAIWRRAAEVDPGVTTLRNNLAFSLLNVGELLARMGKRAEALDAFNEAKTFIQPLVDADTSNISYRNNLSTIHDDVARLMWRSGQPALALAELDQASLIWTNLAGLGNPVARNSLAILESKRANIQLALGLYPEARASCDRALAHAESVVKASPTVASYRYSLAESLLRFGQVRRLTGDRIGAAADWRRAIAQFSGVHSPPGEKSIILACCHAMLSSLAGVTGSGVAATEGAVEADRAMAVLRESIAGGYSVSELLTEAALDPLRARPDFQLMANDAAFPFNPFAPVPGTESESH
jgi:serine/threonine-protein kinase